MAHVDPRMYALADRRAGPSLAARTRAPVAVVSDGGHGLGPAIVRRLARRPMRVVLAGPSATDGRAVIDSLGALADRVAVREVDVTDEESVAALVYWLQRRLGRCDVLVNNIAPADAAGDTSIDTARSLMETSLLGSWRMARALMPLLRSGEPGRIVNISGVVRTVDPDASRVVSAAVYELTRVLAEEVTDRRVLVNAYATEGPDADPDTAVWLATLDQDGPTGEIYSARA